MTSYCTNRQVMLLVGALRRRRYLLYGPLLDPSPSKYLRTLFCVIDTVMLVTPGAGEKPRVLASRALQWMNLFIRFGTPWAGVVRSIERMKYLGARRSFKTFILAEPQRHPIRESLEELLSDRGYRLGPHSQEEGSHFSHFHFGRHRCGIWNGRLCREAAHPRNR